MANNGAVGFLQKKNRFYGWSKHLFLLDHNGLASFPPDPLPRSRKGDRHTPEPLLQVIGNDGGHDLCQVERTQPKQLVVPSNITSVIRQGTKEIVVVTASSGTLVLRAQTTADRDAWVQAIQDAVASAVPLEFSHATSFAETPESSDALEREASRSPKAAITLLAPYIPTLTMSSGLVGGSVGSKISLHLSRLDIGLDGSSLDAEASAIGARGTNASDLGDGAATKPLLPAAISPGIVDSPPSHDEFNVSAFFNDDDVTDSSDLRPLPASKHTLYNRTQNFTSNPQVDTLATLPAPPQPEPLVPLAKPGPPLATHSALTHASNALGGVPSSMDFGSMFDFLREPRTEPVPDHAPASLHLLAPAMPEAPTTAPHAPQIAPQTETLPCDPLPLPAVTRRQSVHCVRPPLQNADPFSVSTGSCGLASAGAASVAAKSGVVLTPSTADFAGSLLDNMGLAGWTHSVEPTLDHRHQSQVESTHAAYQKQKESAGETEQPALAAKLLNSPEHQRLGHRTTPTSEQDAGPRRFTLDGSAVGLSGIQTALLSKYSDSLSCSRALLPSVGRANRSKATHDRSAKTGGPNGLYIGERSATLIQYEPVEPENTGVSKVVRGQIAKDIIQKEVDGRPAVRRMRRVKSETKVVPLKSIRLRLDGSIVGSHASIAPTRDSNRRGMSYVVKDGLIRGAGGRTEQRLGASQVACAGTDASKDASAGVFGEFSEIQARLQMAAEHKRQLQRANILDREGADDVRIADIIENRQDISLAAQLEERRKVQLAKQQVLLQQQLAQQQQQLEQQQMLLEQQRQHQMFKRQSLHPSLNSASQISVGAAVHAGQQGGWQAYGSNGGSNYANQWVQQQQQQHQGAYAGAMPMPSQFQPSHHNHRAYQQGRSAVSVSESSPHWTQQRACAWNAGNHLGASEHSYQSLDVCGGDSGRPLTANSRLQPGAKLYKHARPASVAARSLYSQHSCTSSESWQSRIAPGMSGPSTPARANTEINFDGSEGCASTKSSGMPPRRTSSYGFSGQQRPASQRLWSLSARRHAKATDADRTPPVPPLPRVRTGVAPGGRVLHQEYVHPPPPGPPEYMQAPAHDQGENERHQQVYSSQWSAGQPRAHGWVPQHGPMPPSQAALARHSTYVPGYGGGGFAKHESKAQMLADMQRLSKRRTEMDAKTPSLLQRLDTARTSGILPGRHIEKLGYSQGAYQNQAPTRVIKEGSSTQYLGDGNTLLIDRVYESEKSRSAFLRKISRTYTGIGGDAAPTTTFTH
ncbi:hypothetical protein GGI20_001419 [Coemansia sp. BCRC 34301]|nr:hypothetical protein GGI20_001419 [Coemansia sp. BCRC 34301]